jgi:hypothetical protein
MATEKKQLAILGTASSMPEAPFEDEDFEIWGVASLTEEPKCKRLDRAFEFHPKRHWGQLPITMRLKRFDGPVYMQDHYDEIPNSVAYPREAVKKQFHMDAMGDNLFVTNSITWMILLALHEGYRHISLFGVHMAHDTEYSYQLPSCSWALGVIHGMILAGKSYTLYVAPESSLLKARYEYGFDEPSELMIEIDTRRQRLEAGVKQAQKQQREAELSQAKTEGALTEAKHWYNHVAGYR